MTTDLISDLAGPWAPLSEPEEQPSAVLPLKRMLHVPSRADFYRAELMEMEPAPTREKPEPSPTHQPQLLSCALRCRPVRRRHSSRPADLIAGFGRTVRVVIEVPAR